MELEKLWASVMHQYHSVFAKNKKSDQDKSPTTQLREQRFRSMWRVREHMAFLIRNLQFYIQVVIHILCYVCLIYYITTTNIV
jgi:gamma-tubulin complex component 4